MINNSVAAFFFLTVEDLKLANNGAFENKELRDSLHKESQTQRDGFWTLQRIFTCTDWAEKQYVITSSLAVMLNLH